jgi:ATP-dependent DNA ligase
MPSVVNILDEIESTSGSNAKRELLELHSDNQLLKETFIAAQDPYTTYYVSKFKMPEPREVPNVVEDSDTVLSNFLKMIKTKLATREVTGGAAKDLIVNAFSSMTLQEQRWCRRILLHNLRCGIQETTINKVWPGAVVSFSVALADKLKCKFVKGEGVKILEKVTYPVRVEPKLDGLRCVAIKRDGVVTMYTRNGSVLETVPTIKALLTSAAYDNVVLDGELMGSSWNESDSVIMSSKNKKSDENIYYNVFDAVPVSDWDAQCGKQPYSMRTEHVTHIISLVADTHVRQVPHRIINNEQELLEYFLECLKLGYEGVMLKLLTAMYVWDRSRNMIKFKPFTTFEGIVVGWYCGKRGTKREHLVSGFNVVLQNGIVTNVANGFNNKMYAEIELDPDSWIGKIVEIQAQPDPMTPDGLSEDGKARFPVFKRLRDSSDVDPLVIQAGVSYFERTAS